MDKPALPSFGMGRRFFEVLMGPLPFLGVISVDSEGTKVAGLSAGAFNVAGLTLGGAGGAGWAEAPLTSGFPVSESMENTEPDSLLLMVLDLSSLHLMGI